MTESSTRAPSAGARIVSAFRMRRPDDTLLRRVQEAFALMLLTAGAATLLQLLLVVLLDGPHTAPHWSRVANNGMLVVVMLSSLFGFLTRGRVHASVRATGVGILIYDISFAVCFGLRSTPSIFVMTLAILAGLSIIERARILALWAAAFSIVLLGGLIVTPQWAFSPGPLSLVSGPALALVFFSIYVLEFRDAMLSTTDAVRAQAAMLSTTNAELRRTIDERDRLTEQLAMTHRLEAMGRMAGSIAHDFNNQLTVIRGYSDLIAAETPSASSLRPQRGASRTSRRAGVRHHP